ncbi:hypothetical protein [Embleya sp. NBC_00896]|uniref:hypothetical protein n=1 Tax=Embleya sp. NBC_00896 TaxID=2975961 RepID=UPI0038704949|nr:hypothetical protein OG928_34325 [Embleya sp. NBC_00896]
MFDFKIDLSRAQGDSDSQMPPFRRSERFRRRERNVTAGQVDASTIEHTRSSRTADIHRG